ncbi:MAG: 3-methyladenine DNA glycosylase [Candidatus Zambryskibacteria bacterium CG_4_9_14_3_um_filter_42_9]|nr:MAG: 3-methyladenine DNA glycosylase [Candidatus Zambryskibacteria bacterium CG_4_9_14_3_um_filter_42_9]
MARKRLNSTFFNRKTLIVAEELLGKYLVRKSGDQILSEMITETEAYTGGHDLASHSSKGRTKRTEVMFGKAGTIYVYFVYGMYYMLNIVTEETGYPSAVLIRGTQNFKGPGILTRSLNIDATLNNKPLGKQSGLWIEDRGKIILKSKIKKAPRVGVSYAGPIWANKKYRFLLKELH